MIPIYLRSDTHDLTFYKGYLNYISALELTHDKGGNKVSYSETSFIGTKNCALSGVSWSKFFIRHRAPFDSSYLAPVFFMTPIPLIMIGCLRIMVPILHDPLSAYPHGVCGLGIRDLRQLRIAFGYSLSLFHYSALIFS